MNRLPDVIYLHGLGSSPGSAKAQLVTGHLASLGYRLEAPVLSVPSLATLSVHAAIATVQRSITQRSLVEEVIVIGSSFGAFLALHSVARLPPQTRATVKRLVLLAPVFYPWHAANGIITPEVENQWRRNGVFPIEENATGKAVDVHFEFVCELKSYDSDALNLSIPIGIIHGDNDEVVSIKQSEEYCAKNPNVTLERLPDTHSLMADPDALLAHIREFIGAISIFRERTSVA